MKTAMNRRSFLKSTAAASALAGFNILPASAKSPNDKLNLAVIGCSHQGGTDGKAAMQNPNVNVVALCDVEPGRAGALTSAVEKKQRPKPPVFDDFRKMFDKMGDQIDACTVGVPDHAHFPICMQAISMGKHVYVEKPLAHTFEECELLMAAEKKYKVACQMGNQGHSGNQRRQFEQWVERGIIKDVTKVDAWMNGGRRWHPWGKVAAFPQGDPLPANMNWDVWTGTAPMHPYSKKYDPGNWRGWYDYGCGAFGDWGPHILDSIHRYLKLGLPYEVRADRLDGPNDFIYPLATTIAFEFAARGEGMPAMAINWYDGVKNPAPTPKEYAGKNGRAGKYIYAGDFIIKGGSHSATHQIVSGEVDKAKLKLTGTPKTSTQHMGNFINAAMGKEECNSKFSVSGPLTQMFMLGCIAQRLGGTLKFDAAKGEITNNKRANELLKGHAPRKGWDQYYKL